MKSVVIVGHGSRVEENNELFRNLVEVLKERSDIRIDEAFLSFGKPLLEKKLLEIYGEGIREVVIIPYLLYGGKHVEVHIPEIIKKVNDRHRDFTIDLDTILGLEPLILELLTTKIKRHTA